MNIVTAASKWFSRSCSSFRSAELLRAPTLHDEPAAHLPVYKRYRERIARFLWLTNAERDLATTKARRFEHNPALDGFRGIAVLVVVLYHTGILTGGWIGVEMFFVLSGYLITSLLVIEILFSNPKNVIHSS